MRPLAIAHTECSSGWGGQEIRVFTEMMTGRDRGHRMTLCAPPKVPLFTRCAAAGFDVIPLNESKPAFPLTVLQLARRFRKEHFEVVNPHSSRDGWLAGLAARLARVPCIVRTRHIEVDYPNRFSSRFAFHRLPHHVITTSRRISDRLIRELGLDESRVSCIPTGIDLKKFHPGVEGRLRAELRLAPDTLLVGMVSVLRSWKGHVVFLEAIRQLAPANPRLHFVIAGEGDGRPGIEMRLEKFDLKSRVTLLGYREDVPAILSSLDVLALPSTAHEGIPQIILQAQAMGKPVVGTTIGGIPEVIQDGESGILVPPGNADALAEGLKKMIDDDPLRTRLGEGGRKRAARENSLETMWQALETLYARYVPKTAHGRN